MYADVVVIGAGPCGLAAAARLCEKTPSALFTNDEHARFWRKHKQHRNSLENEIKPRKTSIDSGYASQNEDRTDQDRPSILVLDAHSDQWLSVWKQRFHDLNISHLRSPLFFHPDPSDRDGLLAFAHEQGRVDELCEIPNVAGKELTRHLKIDGRDQIDYFTPSSKLFNDYCEVLVDRYKLRKLVRKAEVKDISHDQAAEDGDQKIFTIHTDVEWIIRSKIIIVATGASIAPSIPMSLDIPSLQGATHVFEPSGTRLPQYLEDRLAKTSEPVVILVVGGGLTSAQVVDLLLSRYQSSKLRVYLLLRHSKLKVKPSDVDLPWVSKTRNHLMSSFYVADSDEERVTTLKEARNGGSITPVFAKLLQKHEDAGRLIIHRGTEIDMKDAQWCNATHRWHGIAFRRADTRGNGSESITIPPVTANHIICCTSSPPSIHDISWLSSLQRTHPIDSLSGLPVLTEDLAWNEDVPCFFTGALAALRLGPGAANLMGARLGAERIAWAVNGILASVSNTRKST